MLKKLLTILFFALLFIVRTSLFVVPANAEGEFITDSKVEYKVDESQKTTVVQQITLENAFSTVYATAYSMVLDNIKPQNVKAFDDKGALSLDKKAEGDKTTLKVSFADALVGKGKSRTFYISYEEGSFAVRTGEVWEISIPRLYQPDSFRNYTVVLKVPTKFGQEAYISPKPESYNVYNDYKIYSFDKNSVSSTGITAGFGQFQVFSFSLNYHLENPLAKSSVQEVALPPDTAFQKVYYQTINPKPQNVSVDADGNWIAIFNLNPRQRLDVASAGSVQIFASPHEFVKPKAETLATNLKSQEFWEVENPQITTLGEKLKTPKAIYDFVSTNLSYDYQRVRPNVERLGATRALASPKQAICMEFTDVFVAIARAAGIPAREINGYAYTENKDIQPLSLVADVLHAWPEYWDSERGVWIPVDPTWGSTTGGVDFFSKLDLRHFTFVVHGASSQKPYPPGSYKLGANPQKDVFVSFGQLPEEKVSVPTIKSSQIPTLPLTNGKIEITLENPGPSALYNLTPTIYFDDRKESSQEIPILPPFAKHSMIVNVPTSLFGHTTPAKISIVAKDKALVIPTFKNQVIIYNLIVLFLVFAIVLILVFLRVKKINFNAFIQRFHRQPSQDENQGEG